MTRFRFCYNQTSYLRYRCRTARHRVFRVELPKVGTALLLFVGAPLSPATASWRCAVLTTRPCTPPPATLRIGDYLIGAEGDPQLHGHPDIRY